LIINFIAIGKFTKDNDDWKEESLRLNIKNYQINKILPLNYLTLSDK